jgi:D-alanyl-D-alanine carboxypeptidase/D-alanyl-D-alanine-endopeptidase (penicillin-binding protein 4)
VPRKLSVAVLLIFTAHLLAAQTLSHEIRRIASRPEFLHSQFGIEFYDLARGKVLFELNSNKLFVPGSTTKLITEGTALALLGPDYRFHTRVYRTAPVSSDGTLEGDLVLVAAGDPNLSARVQPDDTLAFTNNDHSYAGSLPGIALRGDPLLVLKKLAQQVAAHGIKRVTGRVVVDASMFVADRPEPGSGAVISPAIINDNIVDVTVTPGASVGAPTSILISPLLPYVTIINRSTTGAPDSEARLYFSSETANPDGSYTVTLEGSVPAGWEAALAAYKVKTPVRFAEVAFVVALQTAGVDVQTGPPERRDFTGIATSYTPGNMVAEHVSPPFSEEIKITLKSSQNLHAALMPHLLGATLGHASGDPKADVASEAGFALERQFLQKAGLDTAAASQMDGAGGMGAAFTPDFMVRYLGYMNRQPYGATFFNALSIMGRDGTLAETQKNSPAAGHVHAKSGTYVFYNALNHELLLLGKALAGYVDTRRGHRIAFAAFVNQVNVANMDEVERIGDQLAAMAAAAYETE